MERISGILKNSQKFQKDRKLSECFELLSEGYLSLFLQYVKYEKSVPKFQKLTDNRRKF